jgi:hypothetical protein
MKRSYFPIAFASALLLTAGSTASGGFKLDMATGRVPAKEGSVVEVAYDTRWGGGAGGALNVDGVEVWSGSGEAFGIYAWDTTGVASGEHALEFVARDGAGKETAWTAVVLVSRGESEETTSNGIPVSWLERWGHGADAEAFSQGIAANGRTVKDCYIADLNPTDSDADLKMTWGDGKPDYGPKSADRVYFMEGSADLRNPEGWSHPTNATHRYFRVRVEVP